MSIAILIKTACCILNLKTPKVIPRWATQYIQPVLWQNKSLLTGSVSRSYIATEQVRTTSLSTVGHAYSMVLNLNNGYKNLVSEYYNEGFEKVEMQEKKRYSPIKCKPNKCEYLIYTYVFFLTSNSANAKRPCHKSLNFDLFKNTASFIISNKLKTPWSLGNISMGSLYSSSHITGSKTHIKKAMYWFMIYSLHMNTSWVIIMNQSFSSWKHGLLLH